MIRRRAEDGAGGEVPEVAPEGTPAPPAAPAAPSFSIQEDEWRSTQEQLKSTNEAINYLVQMFQEPEPDPQQQSDGDEIDIDAYIDQAVNSRLAPVRPLWEASVKERGEKEMTKIFDRIEAEAGDFDRKLAERVANSFLEEAGGDPVKATEEGARYAAQLRAEERKSGVQAHNERLRQGPPDPEPAVSGGGNTARSKDKSYDDVINRWSGETEA